MYQHYIHRKKGFSLLELMIVLIIVGVLTTIALPYYQNAVQSARATEGVIWWNQVKRLAAGQSMTRSRADRYENDINNNNKLKYFTVKLVCRTKENGELCWEAELHLKKADQAVQYYLSTQENFFQLVCVPLNKAGTSFCQSQAGQDQGPDTEINGQPAYIIHH